MTRVTLRTRVTIGLGWVGGAHWLGMAAAVVTTAVVVPADYAVVAAAGALAGVVGALQGVRQGCGRRPDYAMAFRLATLPRTGFTFVVSRVLFPAMATLQGDERRLGEAFLRALHWVAALAKPTSVGLALVAPDVVTVALGPRWAGTVTPLRILAGFAFFASLAATTGDVFKATGRSVLIFRLGLVHSATLVPGLALFASKGIAWVALAVTVATVVSSASAFACVLWTLRLGPAVIARVLAAPAIAALVMAFAVGSEPVHAVTAAARLGLLVPLGVVVYAAVLALVAPGDIREVGAALAALRARRAPDASVVRAG